MLSRRTLMATAMTLWAADASARSRNFVVREFTVPGSKRLGRRFSLLIPKHASGKVPLLVALHGLGETGSQKLGIRAWLDRYGLASSYDRLCQPPVRALAKRSRHWRPSRLREVNQLLKSQPFRGLAIVCPFTPNVYKMNRKKALDDYADWLVQEVLPRARKEAPVYSDTAHTYLDGCSLGGYVGIEVFLRKAAHFGAWGSVQGAFGSFRVAGYAKKLSQIVKRHGHRHIHLETSTSDPFRKVNEQLSKALTQRKVAHELVVPPGPHNQPFLRDSGTLEMLLWHDRLPR